MQKIAFLADKTEDAQNALSILSKRYGCQSVESAETIVALGGDGVESPTTTTWFSHIPVSIPR